MHVVRVPRWVAVIALLFAVVGVGCGNGGGMATDSTPSEHVASTTTMPAGTTTLPASVPTTTVVSPTTTGGSAGQLRILRPDGIGSADFGVPADAAIVGLTDLLGPPDRDVAVSPPGEGGQECVEGSGWEDCLGVVNEARIVGWTKHGLDVALSDLGGWVDGQPVAIPLHLDSWHVVRPVSGPVLATSEGFEPGMTVGQLRTLYSDIDGLYSEGIVDGVAITMPAGSYYGELEWDPTSPGSDWSELVRAVQRALNAHGARLAIDGEWGAYSQEAWEQFLRGHDLEAPETMWLTPEIGQALGMPADDFVVDAIIGG